MPNPDDKDPLAPKQNNSWFDAIPVKETPWGKLMDSNARGVAKVDVREIVKKISDVAIELAFVRHELTTTEYEDEDYPNVEEGVEAFKALVEEVKTDVFACLTGDEEGCLDPEDVDNDNELEWLKRQLRVNSFDALQAENKVLRRTIEACAVELEESADNVPDVLVALRQALRGEE